MEDKNNRNYDPQGYNPQRTDAVPGYSAEGQRGNTADEFIDADPNQKKADDIPATDEKKVVEVNGKTFDEFKDTDPNRYHDNAHLGQPEHDSGTRNWEHEMKNSEDRER